MHGRPQGVAVHVGLTTHTHTHTHTHTRTHTHTKFEIHSKRRVSGCVVAVCGSVAP